jgi:hypothetical protein
MPIRTPQLDDLRYDRTVEDLVRRIPVHAPEWTDHNDSDPGITLIQLFAFLAEQLGYRLNLVPEKVHIELLKLLGVRLGPALAARSRLALLLADPPTLTGYTLAAGARARAQKGEPPPVFETDHDMDVVPCQTTVLLTTRNPFLDDVLRKEDGTREPVPASPPEVPSSDTEWLTVAWDGKKPKLKDMPLEPVPLFRRQGQPYLWVGLNFNPHRDAGFRGVRVTLTVQFDDDEQPTLTEKHACGAPPSAEPAPEQDKWLAYYDAENKEVLDVPGRIDDSTERFTQSGTVRFTVPFGIGPIPESEFKNLRDPGTVSAVEACLSFGEKLKTELEPPAGLDLDKFQIAITRAIGVVRSKGAGVLPPVAHPLDPGLRAAELVKGWLRLRLENPLDGGQPAPKLRMLTFNAVPVTNAVTVVNELLGTADGRPGQTYRLAHGNVLAGTLQLAVQESPQETTPLETWNEVESLDTAGPFDRVFELDREAGRVRFGGGGKLPFGGRIPPLVPRGGQVVALRYRHGGGKAGEVPVAAITALGTPAHGVEGAVNCVAAAGGRDAEVLEGAKVRVRKELSTRSRAVTAGDFQWIAQQTPAVRVARVEVVPLRRPLPPGSSVTAVTPPFCGPAPPTVPAGLDRITAYGAVAVVVVPDVEGPEPLPTPSFLRVVCEQLDRHRLVTTEVYVVPPQYLRLCNFRITVRAWPGYTRARLQDLVEARLAAYLHVLRGGEDGKGFPFGAQVHVADLIAQVFRTEGVERVEELSCDFTRTKSDTVPRQGRIVLCPAAAGEHNQLSLAPEETASIDLTTFTLTTVV